MYNKLFSKILDSSIWLESMPTRIVWLTLIAAMDETGFCAFASAENVAHRAIVPLDDSITALATLESPDRNSADPENEGRRIERVPGGWLVLNSEKYRAMTSKVVIQEQTRERVRRYRLRNAVALQDVSGVTSNAASAPAIDHDCCNGLGVQGEGADSVYTVAAAAYRALSVEWHTPKLTDTNLAKLARRIVKVTADLVAECDGFTWPDLMERARSQPYIHEKIASFDFEWFLKREYKGTRLNAKKVWNRQFEDRGARRDESGQRSKRKIVSHARDE